MFAFFMRNVLEELSSGFEERIFLPEETPDFAEEERHLGFTLLDLTLKYVGFRRGDGEAAVISPRVGTACTSFTPGSLAIGRADIEVSSGPRPFLGTPGRASFPPGPWPASGGHPRSSSILGVSISLILILHRGLSAPL